MKRLIFVVIALSMAFVGEASAGFAILWDGTVRSYYFTTSDYDNVTNGGADRFCADAGWAALAGNGNGAGSWACGRSSREKAERDVVNHCNQNYGGCWVTWSGYDDDRRNTGWDYMYNLRDFISY